MRQVFLSGKGQVELVDAPIPGRMNGSILIRNSHSVISAGTEGAAVTTNEGVYGLIEKVSSSKDRVDQVWDMVKKQGLSQTMTAVNSKLADYTPIGYSCSGVVLENDDSNSEFKVGDRVACMGAGFANHSEYAVIPHNLAVKLPENVSHEEASFAAIACIAMQGIRRLDLSPGETVAIVGLGLIGQIAIRLATLMGYQTYGIDIEDARVKMADTANGVKTYNSTKRDIVSQLKQDTNGVGMDGVIICAATKVDSLINQAFDMCRARGRVSVVGDIGLGLQRAKMYSKELEVRLSCSYGVGRHDPMYELKGHDYPIAHVRWTERRNLEYFIALLSSGKLSLKDLISKTVTVDRVGEAFKFIKSADNNIFGVLLDYGLPKKPIIPDNGYTTYLETQTKTDNKLCVGLIGVGGYAKNVHLPNLKKISNVNLHAVATKSGSSAALIARKIEASYATSDVSKLLADDEINAVIISTRHSTHKQFVLESLEAGKHVFVEKPMATTIKDCKEIIEAQNTSGKVVHVGFNRRFSPIIQHMKNSSGKGHKCFVARINVGAVSDHWSNTTEEGGRLLGEAVHFFDLANWIMDEEPVSVSAQFVGEADLLNPNACINIEYSDGSVANIIYTTLGNAAQGKEYFELFTNGKSYQLNDYQDFKSFGTSSKLGRWQKADKGQFAAMNEFVLAATTSRSTDAASAVDGLWATAISLAAVQSGRTNAKIVLSEFIASTDNS